MSPHGEIPPPPQPRRRRQALIVAASVLAIMVLMAGFAVHFVRTLTPVALTAAGQFGPEPTPSPTTKVGDRDYNRGQDMLAAVKTVTAAQAKAMLARDEQAFLKPAKSTKALSELQRRYRNLAALRVTAFELVPQGIKWDSTTELWRSEVQVRFCFVVQNCGTDTIVEPMYWADAKGGPELMDVEAAHHEKGEWFGYPQAWELSDLEVSVGKRVIAATTSGLRSRLPELLSKAEKAAAVADKYTVGPKPELYRVYLADARTWKAWSGSERSDWSAGYARPIGENNSEVVLQSASVTSSSMDGLLRHELTHAASVRGEYYWSGNWWLIEGLAELADHPAGFESGNQRDATRQFARKWNGKLTETSPAAKATHFEVSGQYGLAFLAVKRLGQRFGQDRLMRFFKLRVEDGVSYDTASQAVFGIEWSKVEADLVRTVRAA